MSNISLFLDPGGRIPGGADGCAEALVCGAEVLVLRQAQDEDFYGALAVQRAQGPPLSLMLSLSKHRERPEIGA
jgi:hypothetical protein